MIVLFTDFGLEGPYLGQLRAVLAREAPGVPVVDLFNDLPPFNPRAAAYLLPALAAEFPVGSVFLCVVDPGVGSDRRAVVVEADGRWFVGPDNGLFAPLARRARRLACWELTWRPQRLSASFHGRDLFAPVAGRIARGMGLPGQPRPLQGLVGGDWPEELREVVYIDRYGNAVTGLRAAAVGPGAVFRVNGARLGRRRTFAEAPPGEPFWYENSNGLVEFAVNSGSAARQLGLAVGSPFAEED